MASNRFLSLAGVICLTALPCRAVEDQHVREVIARTGAKLELVFPKETYQVGEPIEVTMRYSCTVPEPPLDATVVTYDRGGRISEFGFEVGGKDGSKASDPWKYLLMSMGGLRTNKRVTPDQPFEQKVFLNEWLIFPEPGEYEVGGFSTILHETDHAHGWGSELPLKSAPVRIRIIPADPAWRDQVIFAAREKLAGSRDGAKAAMRSLRFLMSEETIPLMVAGLNDNETSSDAFCGLASLPDQQKVKEALLKSIDFALPSENARWVYISLLSNADVISQKINRAYDDKEAQQQAWDIQKRWRKFLADKAIEKARELPPEQMAAVLVSADSPSDLTLEQKHLILRNARTLDASRTPYLIEQAYDDAQFIPDLIAVAADLKVDPRIRSAAMVQLSKLGVNDFRDAIVADLMHPYPVLTAAAHHSIGSYGSQDIAPVLLKLAGNPKYSGRLRAAKDVRDFGTGISANQLLKLISDLRESDRFDSPELVEALALASPKAALPLLQEILAGKVKSENDFRPIAVTLIARLSIAKEEVRKELAGDEARRTAMTEALLQAAWYSPPPQVLDLSPSSSFRREVPGDKNLVKSLAPELIKLAADDPSDEVRSNAAKVLQVVSDIPQSTNRGCILASQVPEYLPQWREWAEKNASGLSH